MPYLFTCPSCQSRTQVDDQYSGRKGECISCGEPIQVPVFLKPGTAATPAGPKKNFLGWIAAVMVGIVLFGSLAFLAVRAGNRSVVTLRAGRQRTASMNNLTRIASALNTYAAVHGTYPPPVLKDRAGKPLHSWRVLILPQLGENDRYDLIDLSKPWDAPENMAAMEGSPPVFVHMDSTSSYFGSSSYYLVTGPGTLFPPSGPLGPGDVVDGAAKTLLLVEAVGNQYGGLSSWAEPIDLDFATMQGKIGALDGIEPGGVQDDGAAIATVDGTGHFLPDTFSPSVFRSLVTPAGGEPLRDDVLDF